MLLNNEWVKNEIREEIRKFLEIKENELTTTQNQWDIAKAFLRRKFIAIQAHIKKTEKLQTNKDIVSLNNTLEETDLIDIYRESFSSQRSKIYILFKCPWNFFKDRPHDRTQSKPQQSQEN